ncbi:unnamed protein product [Symbiodinium sp. CCMP2592]|nr:unnamed protein product [Symbiodinium sp. CCMP2592]
MAQNTYGSEIPVWDGDPNTFERFASACLWYSYGLKDNERHLAAARVWNKMTGPAKGVIRHLNPEDFAVSDGINKLVAVLRESPLQKLPIPDSFSRLEKWSSLHKRNSETIPQLIVREEELFTELQVSLKRARETSRQGFFESAAGKGKGKGLGSFFPAAANASRPAAAGDGEAEEGEPKLGSATGGSPGGRSSAPSAQDSEQAAPLTGFFEDQLREYRLLKASHLGAHERQQASPRDDLAALGGTTRWYTVEPGLSLRAGTDYYEDLAAYQYDWDPTAAENDVYAALADEEMEAYQLAQEANRTLQQARQAVAKALPKQREIASVAYRKALAADHLSKLNNAVGRPKTKYDAGALVMVWRVRKNGGKGAWTGPVRVIHMEGSTLWLASGASLLRAKLNQVRPCSRTEELTAIANGASIYKMPVMRTWPARLHRARPRRTLDKEKYVLRLGHDGPETTDGNFVGHGRTMPIQEDQLTGVRVTFLKVTGNSQVIRDNYQPTILKDKVHLSLTRPGSPKYWKIFDQKDLCCPIKNHFHKCHKNRLLVLLANRLRVQVLWSLRRQYQRCLAHPHHLLLCRQCLERQISPESWFRTPLVDRRRTSFTTP